MRILDKGSVDGFATFNDWLEACNEQPLYVLFERWRKTEICGVLIPRGESEIHFKKAWRPYSYKTNSYKVSKKPNYGDHILTLTPAHIEIVTEKKPTSPVTSRAEEILLLYGLETSWVPCGPRRYNTCIVIPHEDIDPDPARDVKPGNFETGRWRRNYNIDWVIKNLHSVDWTTGLRFNYKGVPLNAQVPTVAACTKTANSFLKRSNSMSDVHDFAHWLGFGSAFQTQGYPLPKDKSRNSAEALNAEAEKLGYANVAEAWKNNVPVLGELDEEFHEFHAAGLTKLLVDSVKESRKK